MQIKKDMKCSNTNSVKKLKPQRNKYKIGARKHKLLKTRVRMRCTWRSKHPMPTGYTRHVLFDMTSNHLFRIKSFERRLSDWPLWIELDECFQVKTCELVYINM